MKGENPDFTMSKKLRRLAQRTMITPSRRFKKNICFVHVPKCGGNSVALGFINSIPLHRRFTWVSGPDTQAAISIAKASAIDINGYHDDSIHGKEVYDLRRKMALYAMHQDQEFVGGHFLFDEQSYDVFNENYAWVTVMRDPVHRMISHYREEVRSGLIADDFELYLDGPIAQRHSTMLARYYSGWNNGDLEVADLASRALTNLEKFDVVGFLNSMDSFQSEVATLTGRRIRMGYSRKAVAEMPSINEDLVKRVQEMCKTDTYIFSECKKRCEASD